MYVILAAVSVVTLVPLLYAFFASFKPVTDILTNGAQLFPETWTFDNYVTAWRRGGFARYFANSVFVAAGVTLTDLVASSLLGYLLARQLVPFRRALQSVMAVTLFLGLGTATLYPRLELAQLLRVDNLIGVVLIELSGLMVVHVFLIRAYCQTLPLELEDAARVDGCGLVGTYRRIVFPLLRPILTTTGILAFQAAWNSFQIPYIFTLSTPELRTLVVGVYALRSTEEGSQAYDLILAGAMLIIVPIVVLFVFFQRYFVRGLTEGSVKG